MKQAHLDRLRYTRSITLLRLINVARGADSIEDWPFPPFVPEDTLSDDDRMWMDRFLDLKNTIKRLHLPATNTPNGEVYRNSSLVLEDYWRLTQMAKGPELDWLREICSDWADLLNVDLALHGETPSDVEIWMEEEIRKAKEAGIRYDRRKLWEMAAEKFGRRIPQSTIDELKMKIAPDWSAPGRPKKNR